MTFGNNGAGPVGVPPVGPNPNAGQVIGTGGGTYPPLYNPSFESVLAAVSRGEVSLNQVVAPAQAFGGAGNANGNPTLLQAMSQGVQQNSTNGIGVRSGPSIGEGTSAVGIGSANPIAGAIADSGSTLVVDPRGMLNAAGAVALANPIQYGGN